MPRKANNSRKSTRKTTKSTRKIDAPYSSHSEDHSPEAGESVVEITRSSGDVNRRSRPLTEFIEHKLDSKFKIGTLEHLVILAAKRHVSWGALNGPEPAIPQILIDMYTPLPPLPATPDLTQIKDPELYSVLLAKEKAAAEERKAAAARAKAAAKVITFIEETLVGYKFPHLLRGAASDASMQELVSIYRVLGCSFKWRKLRGVKYNLPTLDEIVSNSSDFKVLWNDNNGEDAYNALMTFTLKKLEYLTKREAFRFAVWPFRGDDASVQSAVDTLCAFTAKPRNSKIFEEEEDFDETSLVTIVEYKWMVSSPPTPLNRLQNLAQGVRYAVRYLDMTPHEPHLSNSDGMLQLRVLVACVIKGTGNEIAFSLGKALVKFPRGGPHEIVIDPTEYITNQEDFVHSLVEKWEEGEIAAPMKGF